jgi:hypothetical protein
MHMWKSQAFCQRGSCEAREIEVRQAVQGGEPQAVDDSEGIDVGSFDSQYIGWAPLRTGSRRFGGPMAGGRILSIEDEPWGMRSREVVDGPDGAAAALN